jgi:hypothetical protein
LAGSWSTTTRISTARPPSTCSATGPGSGGFWKSTAEAEDEAAGAEEEEQAADEERAGLAAAEATRNTWTGWRCTAADTPDEAPTAAALPALLFPHVVGTLVTHLRQNRRIRDLCLSNANLWPAQTGAGNDDDDSDDATSNVDAALQPSDADLRALFGRIVPSHPALNGITLVKSRVHPMYLRLLTEALQGRSGPWWPAFRVHLVETSIGGVEGCLLLKDAMIQGYADVGDLNNLDVTHCQVGQQGFQVLCEGIAASRALYSAEISERTARIDAEAAKTLARALTTPRSPLFGLSVGAGSWSDDGFALLMAALKRSSSKLETLALRSYDSKAGFGANAARLLEEVVTTYNFNVRRLELDPWPQDEDSNEQDGRLAFQKRIEALVARNGRVRNYATRERHLQSDWSVWPRLRSNEVKCRSLWPRVLSWKKADASPTSCTRSCERAT